MIHGAEYRFYKEGLHVVNRDLPGFDGPMVRRGKLARSARFRIRGIDFMFAKGSWMEFYYDGSVEKGTLDSTVRVRCGANDIVLESRTMKEKWMESIEFFGNGAVSRGLLARDTRVRIGTYTATLARGNTPEHVTSFYPQGAVRIAMLAEDATLGAGNKSLRLKKGTTITLYPNGSVMRGTLAEAVPPEASGVSMEIPAGSLVELYADGKVASVFTGASATVSMQVVRFTAPAQSWFSFFRSGAVQSASVKEPLDVTVQGHTIFKNRYGRAELHENGRIAMVSFSVSSRHRAGGRMISCAPGSVSFHANGSLMEAEIAEPISAIMNGVSLTFMKGRVRFYDTGAIESGMIEGTGYIDRLTERYFPGFSTNVEKRKAQGFHPGKYRYSFHRNGAVRSAYIENSWAIITSRIMGGAVMPDSGNIGFHADRRPSFFTLREDALLSLRGKPSRIPQSARLVLAPSSEVFSIYTDRDAHCLMGGKPTGPHIGAYVVFHDYEKRIVDALAFRGIDDLFGWNQRPDRLVFPNIVIELEPLVAYDENDVLDTHIWVRYDDFHSATVRSLLFARERRGFVDGREVRFPAFRWVDVGQ
ncbi:MAG TPA: hypothetical protein PKM65_12205 [Spirochaetota bacterium]|nr:hypothetical protein [Spirochaetota bacterium]HNT09562.1 hypothetical protein [Spirochaetota bacterium]